MRLGEERLIRVPRPFAVTDDELRPPVGRAKESQLRARGEREPPLSDREATAAREEPATDEERPFDEQIIDGTPIRDQSDPGTAKGRRLAASEDVCRPVQCADGSEYDGSDPASAAQEPDGAEDEAHRDDGKDRMRPDLVAIDRDRKRDPDEIRQVRSDDEERDGNLASRSLAELGDTKMTSDHQRGLNPARTSADFASITRAQVIIDPRGTEVAAGSLTSTGREMSDGRLEALRRDLEARIRPLVRDLSEEEFRALIERMAQLQYKYEARRADDFFDRLKVEDQSKK